MEQMIPLSDEIIALSNSQSEQVINLATALNTIYDALLSTQDQEKARKIILENLEE